LQKSQTAHRGPPRRTPLSYLERFVAYTQRKVPLLLLNGNSRLTQIEVNRMGVVGEMAIFQQLQPPLSELPTMQS